MIKVSLWLVLEGVLDPKIVEALACKESLSWLKLKKISSVHIELDSLVVVHAFDSQRKDSFYFGSIIDDCKLVVKDLGSYSMYFVRRSTNSAAHTLSYSISRGWFFV